MIHLPLLEFLAGMLRMFFCFCKEDIHWNIVGEWRYLFVCSKLIGLNDHVSLTWAWIKNDQNISELGAQKLNN